MDGMLVVKILGQLILGILGLSVAGNCLWIMLQLTLERTVSEMIPDFWER